MKPPRKVSPDSADSAAPSSKKPGLLTDDQRRDITRRVLAGERGARLVEEFGVSKAYVSLLKQQALNPERFRLKKEAKLSRKLTEPERNAFREALATGTPQSHGLEPPSEYWTHAHGRKLAEQLFGKAVSVRVLEEFLPSPDPVRQPWVYERPQPPGPPDVRQLSPEAAADPEFVAWYLSPIAAQLAQRSYEAAVRDYDARYGPDGNLKTVEQRRGRPPGRGKTGAGDGEPVRARELLPLSEVDIHREMLAMEDLGGEWPDAEHWPLASDLVEDGAPAAPAPGQRTGKHAKSKGTNHTPPKRGKKRR